MSELENKISEILNLIKTGKTKSAIEEGLKITENLYPDEWKRLLSLFSQHEEVLAEERMGYLTQNSANTERNRIKRAFLEIITNLKRIQHINLEKQNDLLVKDNANLRLELAQQRKINNDLLEKNQEYEKYIEQYSHLIHNYKGKEEQKNKAVEKSELLNAFFDSMDQNWRQILELSDVIDYEKLESVRKEIYPELTIVLYVYHKKYRKELKTKKLIDYTRNAKYKEKVPEKNGEPGAFIVKGYHLIFNSISTIYPLVFFDNIESLNVRFQQKNTEFDFSIIGDLIQLKNLLLEDCFITDYGFVGNLEGLESLTIKNCDLTQINFLNNMKLLSCIHIELQAKEFEPKFIGNYILPILSRQSPLSFTFIPEIPVAIKNSLIRSYPFHKIE